MSPDQVSPWCLQILRVGEAETLESFAEGLQGWLLKARGLHPVLAEADRLSGGTRASRTDLAPDLSNLRDWIYRYAWDRKADPRSFSEVDEKGQPTPAATCRTGFGLGLGTPPPWPKLWMRLQAIPEGLGNCGHITMQFLGAAATPSLLDPSFLIRLIEITVDQYDPDSCCVYSLDYEEAIGNAPHPDRPDPFEFLRLGWINYFGNPAVQGVLPADVERMPMGPGLLVQTQATLPDLSSPDDVERGRRLVQALDDSGWLKLSRMKRGG